jgi:hypothetical protein
MIMKMSYLLDTMLCSLMKVNLASWEQISSISRVEEYAKKKKST